MSAYDIIDSWLRFPFDGIGHEQARFSFEQAHQRIVSGDSRLIDSQHVADYAFGPGSMTGIEVADQFAAAMSPVVSPWKSFALSFRDRERRYLIYGLTIPVGELGAFHPLFPHASLLSLQWFTQFGQLWVASGGAIFHNFDHIDITSSPWRYLEPVEHFRVQVLRAPWIEEVSKPLSDLVVNRLSRVSLMTLVFATARNAREEEVPMSRAERRRTVLPPSVRFTRVVIDPMRSRRGGVDLGGDADVPWHMVRGHFAYYSPEKPMFGRPGMHGRYWISEHERGDKAHGLVVKDYTVLPPSSSPTDDE